MRPAKLSFALLMLLNLGGCASTIPPETLSTPKEILCINISEPITYTFEVGLVDAVWTARLERGPYISEKEDASGTYFRAPQGGISVARLDLVDKSTDPGVHQTHDGGFWLPHNPQIKPRTYQYFSMQEVPPIVPPKDASCSTSAYVTDPDSSGASVLSLATGGAIGGAVGRSMAPNSAMSYGQSAAGGAIGGIVVAQIINMDVGKIILGRDIENEKFIEQLRIYAQQKTQLRDISNSAVQPLTTTSTQAK